MLGESLSSEQFGDVCKGFLQEALQGISQDKITFWSENYNKSMPNTEQWAYIRKDVSCLGLIKHLNEYMGKKSKSTSSYVIFADGKVLKKGTVLFFEIRSLLRMDLYQTLAKKYTSTKIKTFMDQKGLNISSAAVVIVYQDSAELTVKETSLKGITEHKVINQDAEIGIKIIGHVQADLKDLFIKCYNLEDANEDTLYRKLKELSTKNLELKKRVKKLENRLNIKYYEILIH